MCPFYESMIPLFETHSLFVRVRSLHFDKSKTRVSLQEFQVTLSRVKVPSNVFVRIPKQSKRPSRLTCKVALNILSLGLGVTFPLPDYLSRVFCEMRVAPVQLHLHVL